MISQTARSFRIFVSSTFTDLEAERNALQERVFPRLHELCQRYGARFQAVDLRWGVSDEASLDQQTMKICLGEIARCQRVTSRPNFLILLGDRYGWRPLPYAVPAAEFDQLLPFLTESERALACWREDQPADARGWYRRDDNAVPPEYVLLPRQPGSKYAEFTAWQNEVERPLLAALERAARQVGLAEDAPAKYTLSATEQEIIVGALKVRDAGEHVFGFIRYIEGLPQDNKDFGNTDADDAQKQKELKVRLRKRLPGNIHEYAAQWQGNGPSLDHLDKLCEDVFNSLSQIIEKEIEYPHEVVAAEEEQAHIRPDDTLDVEGLAHRQFAEERLRFFVGRTEMLAKIEQYLQNNQRRTLAITGAGGTGKSTLMAMAIQRTQEIHPNAEIVYRFIGVTPGSSDARSLLAGLCHEMSRRYEVNESDIPIDYRDLVLELEKRMRLAMVDKPLILFLDSLDQLSTHQDPRGLAWLPIELPEHVSVIASTREEDMLESLKAKQARLEKLGGLSWQEGNTLLSQWLASVDRTLQAAQRKEVLDKFVQSEGNPLYLKLAFEEARLWNSNQPPKPLNPEVKGVIEKNLIKRLESEDSHGKALVSHALGYLAASRYGLMEGELLDLLSRDLQVYEWFFGKSFHLPRDLVDSAIEYRGNHLTQDGPAHGQSREAEERAALAWLKEIRNSPEKLRGFLSEVLPKTKGPHLPVVLWSRLSFDLQPYLTERLMDGSPLLNFYHRELGEAAKAVFLAEDKDQPYHKRLAEYFRFKADPNADQTWTGNSPRGLSELPYHLIKAKSYEEVYRTLTDFRFLEHKAVEVGVLERIDEKGNMVKRALATDFAEILEGIPNDHPRAELLRILERAIRTDIHFLSRRPQALFQCLWNTCWWRDSPESALHYDQEVSTLGGVIVAPKPESAPKISTWLEDWRKSKESADGTYFWLRSLRPPEIAIGSSQTSTFQGHEALVNCLALSADGRYLASGSDDRSVRVWDVTSSAEVLCLRGHSENVSAVSFSPFGDRLVSGGGRFDWSVRIWDIKSGSQVLCLTGHRKRVTDVAFSPDGRLVVSSSLDKTIQIWDADTGQRKFCLTGHKGPVKKAAFIPGQERVISVGSGSWNYDDPSVHLWDARTGDHLGCLVKDTGFAHIGDLRVSHDGAWFVVAGFGLGGAGIRIFDLESGQPFMQLKGGQITVNSISISPDGSRLASGSNFDGSILIHDIRSRTKVEALRSPEYQVHSRDDNEEFFTVAFAPDGISLYSAAGPIIRQWHMGAQSQLSLLVDHAENIKDITFSNDGSRISTTAYDNIINIWNSKTGVRELSLKTRNRFFSPKNSLFSLDDRLLLQARDGGVRVWDLRTRKELKRFRGGAAGSLSDRITFSSDGRLLCQWGSVGHEISIWDVQKGKQRYQLNCREEGVNTEENVAFSPDNTLFAFGSDCEVLPDGLLGLFATDRHRIRVVALKNGEEVLQLKGHKNTVTNLCFSPDAKFLVSGSSDGTVRLWAMSDGTERLCLSGHRKYPIAVAYSEEGQTVITRDVDHTRVWDAKTGELVRLIEGSGDIRALAGGSKLVSSVAFIRGTETVIETTDGRELAWLPTKLDLLKASANGRTWAAARGKHLYLFTLESR